MNVERLERLDACERAAAERGETCTLECVLDAFLRPLLVVGRDARKRNFRRLAGRL